MIVNGCTKPVINFYKIRKIPKYYLLLGKNSRDIKIVEENLISRVDIYNRQYKTQHKIQDST